MSHCRMSRMSPFIIGQLPSPVQTSTAVEFDILLPEILPLDILPQQPHSIDELTVFIARRDLLRQQPIAVLQRSAVADRTVLPQFNKPCQFFNLSQSHRSGHFRQGVVVAAERIMTLMGIALESIAECQFLIFRTGILLQAETTIVCRDFLEALSGNAPHLSVLAKYRYRKMTKTALHHNRWKWNIAKSLCPLFHVFSRSRFNLGCSSKKVGAFEKGAGCRVVYRTYRTYE